MDEDSDIERSHSSGSGIVTGAITILLIIGIAKFYDAHKTDYSKPWWTGTTSQKICDVPRADDNDKCWYVPVTSDGTNVTSVSFPNGGNKYFDDSICDKAGSGQGLSRLCNVYSEGHRFQVLLPEN